MNDTDEEFLKRTKIRRLKLKVPEFRDTRDQTITLEQWDKINEVRTVSQRELENVS